MKKTDINKVLLISGGGLTVFGCFAKLFDLSYAPYIFSVGAAFLIYIQLMYTIDNKNADSRQKRLTRNGLFSSLFLVIAAYFMFKDSNSWVVAVLIYALSTLFISFRGNQK
jgi:Ca2+/Na+ antiporter